MNTAGLIAFMSIMAAADIDGFFDTFAEKREGVTAAHALFRQENVTPDEILTSEGEVLYVEPRRIMFRYFDPAVTYLVDGDRMYEYDADLEQVQIYDVRDQPAVEAMFLGLDKNTERLRETFNLDLFTPEDPECGEQGIMLLPKDDADEAAPVFQRARINLSEPNWLPCYVRVDNDADSYFDITLGEYALNDNVNLQKMFITVPEGTRIIENDVLVEKAGPGGKVIPAPQDPAAGAE